MLRAEPEDYFRRLGAFLGRDIAPPPPERRDNQGRRMPAVRLALLLNRFAPKSPLSQRPSLAMRLRNRIVGAAERLTPAPLARRMEEEARAAIAARYDGLYCDSNRKLAEMTGLPLARYGYM